MNGNGNSPAQSREQGQGGHRLADAFELVSVLPVLASARDRVVRAASRAGTPPWEIAAAVTDDLGLTVAVMRQACEDGPVDGVRSAVESLGSAGVGAIAADAETYGFFDRPSEWGGYLHVARQHARGVRTGAMRIATLNHFKDRDALAAAALLHDVGKLVLVRLYPGLSEELTRVDRGPEERLAHERRELGIDHAVVGGVLVRRWGLGKDVANAVERHHKAGAGKLPAMVRLADALAHYGAGNPVDPADLEAAASEAGIEAPALDRLLFEHPFHEGEQTEASPSPLSGRETDALRGLAEGKVYREIADELGLSQSTVRSHLHNVYRKLGAADRAQAVLLARDRGWI